MVLAFWIDSCWAWCWFTLGNPLWRSGYGDLLSLDLWTCGWRLWVFGRKCWGWFWWNLKDQRCLLVVFFLWQRGNKLLVFLFWHLSMDTTCRGNRHCATSYCLSEGKALQRCYTWLLKRKNSTFEALSTKFTCTLSILAFCIRQDVVTLKKNKKN